MEWYDSPERPGLLIDPLITNNQPWLRGYAVTIVHEALSEDERLSRHCFWAATGIVDEFAEPVDRGTRDLFEGGVTGVKLIAERVETACGRRGAPSS